MRTFAFAVSQLKEFNKTYENSANYVITWVSTLNNPKNNTLMFVSKFRDDTIELLRNVQESIIIASVLKKESFKILEHNNVVLYVENPRLEYAKLVQYIIEQFDVQKLNHYECGENTIIEDGAIVKNGAVIGNNCIIKSGAVINDRVVIGDGTIIRENSVVGGYGFGFEREECGLLVRIPHIGGVIIGKNVEIGALCTVVSGTIEATLVDDGTKTDDHVHIAHNCKIGKNCSLTACVEISGSVHMGDNVEIGPNASIMNGIQLGKGCFIGLGAVVLKSVGDNCIVAGNPARDIELIKRDSRAIKELLKNHG